MFTGIIERLGEIVSLEREGSNLHIELRSNFTHELKIDQSVAHNGCCLTVVKIDGDKYVVTAIDETLQKTSLIDWKVGTKVNLERCMQMNGRLDGHIVQGHVDQIALVDKIVDLNGSWEYFFSYEEGEHTTVPKGSITVNGTSLTVCHSAPGEFSVAIIPYTYEHTVFHTLVVGDKINLEFDIIGKYVARMMGNYKK